MTSQTSQSNPCKTPRTQPVPETGEMHFQTNKN